LAAAAFAVNAHFEISRLDDLDVRNVTSHAVVFFESSVVDYQVLQTGLNPGTDSVLLDSAGDGVREMAAFLANRHDLTAIGIVAHGQPGSVDLGAVDLSLPTLNHFASQLAAMGSALLPGGELDFWSCEVGAGRVGTRLLQDIAAATGAQVAASDHLVGASSLGGDWQLNVRTAGATGDIPFSKSAETKFQEVLATWNPAASMATPRAAHTATLLNDGDVLIAGGGNTTTLSSAELYDPAANVWSPAASMATARQDHTATLLNNGMVLIVGGSDNNTVPLASAELYDPVKNAWSSAGSMATPRDSFTATLLGNGDVLVTGGGDLSNPSNPIGLSSAELYDPSKNTWSAAASMSAARIGNTATLLGNGKVLVTGGYTGGALGSLLASVELYDPAANTWSPVASMAIPRFAAAATLLADGKVLVTGGLSLTGVVTSAELYDPASNTWSSAGSMATARYGHLATLLKDGTVLVTGGNDSGNTALASAELYDPTSNSWSSAGSMATARITQTATLLGNGNVLVTGGGDQNQKPLASAELYGQATLAQATQFVISGLSANSVTAGGTITFTLTAEDSTGTPVPSYTGTVQLTSTDGRAAINGAGLPASYTFVAADKGAHHFTVMLASAGTQTITVTDQANNTLTANTSPITVKAGPFSQFVVNAPAGNTLTAGGPFLFTAQAADSFGNPVTSYNGPSSVTIAATPADPEGNFPITGALNSSGFGLFVGDFKTVGSYTLNASADTFSGHSGPLAVTPGDAHYFTVTVPANATTGTAINATVTAFDHYGNVATDYTGTVRLTSTDPAANLGSYTFTSGTGKDNGVHAFPVTLKTAGSQTITATDTTSTNPTITGTSSTITTRGLVVTSLTPTATGFTVNFSEPFTVADVNLYGGSQASPRQDVTLVGASSGPVNGSFVVDPSGTSATFKASSIFLSTFFQSSVLPDDTWAVTLVSGTGTGATAHGFFDSLNAALDGNNNAGHSNYTTSFTTANGSKEALSIPDFARGPDGANTIKVPNDSAKGIPVTLANVPAASAVTDVVFTLTYNPTLLTPTGAGTGDSSGTGRTFVMGTPVSADATHSTVTFTWHNGTAQSGTVVLGDILANVPDLAANEYKGKEILGLSGIKVNGSDFTGVWANGLHVNTYFGDVTGDGKISGLDVATAGAVAGGGSEGLTAFKLVDPAVVGDIAGDASIDATAVSDLASSTSSLPTPQIPAIPTGLTIAPGGPDPTLSLGVPQRQGDEEKGRQGENLTSPGLLVSLSPGLVVSVPVLLDDPHPDGSTGMEEAVLALTYDPKVLTVTSSDITLGSIPGLEAGWHLVSAVDQATGQIGIDLYSTTAISATQAGSLVNIAFHIQPGAPVPATAVQLVNSVAPNGRYFSTEVADEQGQYVLSPGLDRLVIETGSSPVSLAAPVTGDNDSVLAFQSSADGPIHSQGFQIGSLPLLNTHLLQNSPRQLATDRLFLALARRGDMAGDASQYNLWSLADLPGGA
jgi:N-acetylneuraminic acid mutarotase